VCTHYGQIEVANRSIDGIAPSLNEGIAQGASKLSFKLHAGQLGPLGLLLLYPLLLGERRRGQNAGRSEKEAHANMFKLD
jgi:hypothetical protein